MIAQKVKSGHYQTASEVVREALRLMQRWEEQRAQWLREEIRKGIDAIERGEYVDYDATERGALTRDVVAHGKRQLAATKRKVKR